jgi:hypothetical protein
MATLQKPLEHTVVQEPLVHELLDAGHSAWRAGLSQGDRIILTRLPFLSHGLCYAAPTRNPLERSMSHG